MKIGVWPKVGFKAFFTAGQAWKTPQPLQIKSVELNWVKRQTSQEPNWLNWVWLMWSTAFDPGLIVCRRIWLKSGPLRVDLNVPLCYDTLKIADYLLSINALYKWIYHLCELPFIFFVKETCTVDTICLVQHSEAANKSKLIWLVHASLFVLSFLWVMACVKD